MENNMPEGMILGLHAIEIALLIIVIYYLSEKDVV